MNLEEEAVESSEHFLERHPDRLLRLSEVLVLVGVSRSTWYRWIEAGRAPPPMKFFSGGSSWRYGEIMKFLRSPQDYYYSEVKEETPEV